MNEMVWNDLWQQMQQPTIKIEEKVLGEVFYEAWERLRDLLRQCPHHGIPKHEITQIFYDGLGAPDRYLLDAASGGTFMSK